MGSIFAEHEGVVGSLDLYMLYAHSSVFGWCSLVAIRWVSLAAQFPLGAAHWPLNARSITELATSLGWLPEFEASIQPLAASGLSLVGAHAEPASKLR